MLWCCAALIAQDAAAADAVAADAVAVRGAAELTPAEAVASARERMAEQVRAWWRDRAARTLAAERPVWLPSAVADAATARWLATMPIDDFVRVVDREDRVRDHGFGASHQTTLWISEPVDALPRGERSLRAAVRAAVRDLAARGGAVAAGWTAIGFGVAWFDRLTRGYMTWTLRLSGLLLAIAVPALAAVV